MGAGQGAGEDGAGQVLAAAVNGVEDGGFEVVVKAGGEVVGGGELVVDGAGQAADRFEVR